MGVLTDVFIGDRNQVENEHFPDGPSGHFQTLEGKGLFPDSIEKLWQIVDPVVKKPKAKDWIVKNKCGNSECTIYLIQVALVTATAQVPDDRIGAIKLAWFHGGKLPLPDPFDGNLKDWFDELSIF